MMMNLGLGWRRGYSAMAGLKSSFIHLPMQLLSGDRDSSTLYINSPTVGVPGPNLSCTAVEFNHGTAIQRAVSRTNKFFISNPTDFHTHTLVYLEQLTDTVIWALVPAKSMSDVTAQFRLRLKYLSAYSLWVFAIELLTSGGSTSFVLHSRYAGYWDETDIENPVWVPAPVFSVPGWYSIVTSLPYTTSSLASGRIFVNGDLGETCSGTYAITNGLPYQNLALFFSIADDDLYDGILGQTEGARRLVGRVAIFSHSVVNLSTLDTDSGNPRNFTRAMARKLYWTACTFSSPFEKPHQLSAKTRLAPHYKNSLQTQLGFRGSL